MTAPKSKKGIIKQFQAASVEVQEYFEHLPRLVKEFPLDVGLAHLFAKVELAHNVSLYCGVVKLHRANYKVAWQVMNTHHMTRKAFRERFETVLGEKIPENIEKPLRTAERIRDQVMHGKEATDAKKREAIGKVIQYADLFNQLVKRLAGFMPFGGELRGFKGRAGSLDESTTRWLLKGMGFSA